MPSNWENIQKILQGQLSDAAATTRKYFKIGNGELDMMNIDNDSLNNTVQNLGIGVYDHLTGEI